jgi:hypothetical protein
MEIFEAIYTLRAVRRLNTNPVSEELVWKVQDAAIRAPSSYRRVFTPGPGLRLALRYLSLGAVSRLAVFKLFRSLLAAFRFRTTLGGSKCCRFRASLRMPDCRTIVLNCIRPLSKLALEPM